MGLKQIWCRICREVRSFGLVGKIEDRPLKVYQCLNCFDLFIDYEQGKE